MWDIVPQDGDTVETASYIVTIDTNINQPNTTIQNTGGGYYQVTAGGRTITLLRVNCTHATSDCLRFTHSSGTCTLTATCEGGIGSDADGVVLNGAGTLYIYGNCWGTRKGNFINACGVRQLAGTLYVIGDCYQGQGSASSQPSGSNGVRAQTGSACVITGNCYGLTSGAGGVGSNGNGVAGWSVPLTVTGNAYGCAVSGQSGCGIYAVSGLTLNGHAYGGVGANHPSAGVWLASNTAASTINGNAYGSDSYSLGYGVHNTGAASVSCEVVYAGQAAAGLNTGGLATITAAVDSANGMSAVNGRVQYRQTSGLRHRVQVQSVGGVDLVPSGSGGGAGGARVIGSSIIVALEGAL